MPIKWSARQVAESLDRLEKIIDEAEPILKGCGEEALATTKLPNLPEYMSQPLMGFAGDLDYFIEKCRSRIDRIRGYIPKADLAREKREFDRLLAFFEGDSDKAQMAMALSAKAKVRNRSMELLL